jgi:hypothetical protein
MKRSECVLCRSMVYRRPDGGHLVGGPNEDWIVVPCSQYTACEFNEQPDAHNDDATPPRSV